MSFLDEVTIRTTPEKLAKVTDAAGEDDTIEVMEKKGKDLDGDGDIDSKDYLAARDAAIKKAKMKKKEVEEGKLSKVLGGAAVLAAILGINKASSEALYNGDSKIKSLTTQYEEAKEKGDKQAMAKFEKEIENRKTQIDVGKFEVDEAKKTVELPMDTTFTLDLKHLMKKHMDEGKSQEDVVKLTKALMKKLHDKGEVKVDGTKVIFKEAKKKKSGYMGYTELAEEDAQLALPEPDAPDFLGDDGKDYEGGMAKNQMLKMKKYAAALCDMIEDESQLEAWVQAKLTKASDYMSAVYHYLDYQATKSANKDEMMVGSKPETDRIFMGDKQEDEE